ncbi:MAG: hypothetical protein AAGF11_22265 [Myxococcota bacterium]
MLDLALATLLIATAPARPAQASVPGSPATDRRSPGAQLERGYLRVAGYERTPLVEALVLRVPHLKFEPFEAAGSSPAQMAAFVDVRREPSEPTAETIDFALTIVVSDGRAFDRRVQTQRDDEETTRLLASTTANLLLAIEAGTVEADRGDVPLPTVTAPSCPACECPAPPDCPPPSEPSPASDSASATEPPRIELGPVVMASSVLGLGAPQQADRFAAAGATLGVHARLRRGAFFGAELRGVGRRGLLGVSLARLRVALGGGLRLRRKTWSLGASLWATVEPWRVRGGEIEPPPRAQWGLAARVSPALWVPELVPGRLGLSVGPLVELSASGSLISDGPATGLVVIRDDSDVDRGWLRVGGLELSTGLSVTLWFGAGRRPQ